MKITFCLRYQTHIGEELCVNVCQPDGNVKQYRMHSTDNIRWKAIVDTSIAEGTSTDYYYSVHRQTTEIRREWQSVPHRLDCVRQGSYTCYDAWNDMPEDSYLYSSAFTDCIQRR